MYDNIYVPVQLYSSSPLILHEVLLIQLFVSYCEKVFCEQGFFWGFLPYLYELVPGKCTGNHKTQVKSWGTGCLRFMILPVFYDFQYIYLVLARTNMAENPKKKLAHKKTFSQ